MQVRAKRGGSICTQRMSHKSRKAAVNLMEIEAMKAAKQIRFHDVYTELYCVLGAFR